jgi:hypothetical protein
VTGRWKVVEMQTNPTSEPTGSPVPRNPASKLLAKER